MNNSNGKILFIKPFEIDSSGNSFAEAWTNIKKAFRSSEGNQFAVLVRSVINITRYGFVSLAAWDSRLSFRNAIRNSIIVKYHITGNVSEYTSELSYIYKVADNRFLKLTQNGKKLLLLNFIKSEKNDNFISDYWREITDHLQSKNTLFNSILCKSVSGKAEYAYIIIIEFLPDALNYVLEIMKKGKPHSGIMRGNLFSVYESKLAKSIDFRKC